MIWQHKIRHLRKTLAKTFAFSVVGDPKIAVVVVCGCGTSIVLARSARSTHTADVTANTVVPMGIYVFHKCEKKVEVP